MNDLNHAAVCGYYCGSCQFLGEQCLGCGNVDGKPFWTVEMPGGVCPIYDCCTNKKQLEHCGLCEDMPCQIILELRDPDSSDEVFQASLQDRQKNLKRRLEIGTELWLEEMNSDAS